MQEKGTLRKKNASSVLSFASWNTIVLSSNWSGRHPLKVETCGFESRLHDETNTPVVQRIGYRPPKPVMAVRIRPGVQQACCRLIGRTSLFLSEDLRVRAPSARRIGA